MRLITILMTTLICQLVLAQGQSLKIQLEDELYYPPNLKFEVLNDSGEQILNEKNLSLEKPIVLEGHYTINVFTTWADGKDTFKVDDEALIALEDNKSIVSLNKTEQKSWDENQPKVIGKNFQANNDEYDVIIEFENDIFFNYIDGKAEITENGKPLKLLGKYVSKTSEGFLKMSYDPETTEFWYVFTDTYNKVIYK